MSMRELEKMVRRAKSNWKEGCNDRNAAEYSIAVVNAATNAVTQFDACMAVPLSINSPVTTPGLIKALEDLRNAVYPALVRAIPAEDEPIVMAHQTTMEKAAVEFVNPIDAMKKSLEDAA